MMVPAMSVKEAQSRAFSLAAEVMHERLVSIPRQAQIQEVFRNLILVVEVEVVESALEHLRARLLVLVCLLLSF